MSKEKVAENPKIPTVYELGVKPEARKWLDWELDVEETGRTLVMPPDTPADRVKFMRDAMAKVVKDAGFMKDVARRKYSVQYLPGDKIQDVFTKVMVLTDKEKKELIYILKTKYLK
jgi:tripartite-type tricarboxylate transporter receptor subunit TctC